MESVITDNKIILAHEIYLLGLWKAWRESLTVSTSIFFEQFIVFEFWFRKKATLIILLTVYKWRYIQIEICLGLASFKVK